ERVVETGLLRSAQSVRDLHVLPRGQDLLEQGAARIVIEVLHVAAFRRAEHVEDEAVDGYALLRAIDLASARELRPRLQEPDAPEASAIQSADLPVDDGAGWGQLREFGQFRERSAHVLAVAAAHLHAVLTHTDDRAEAVPLPFERPVVVRV